MCRATATAAVIFSSRIFVLGRNTDLRPPATARTCASQPEILGNPSINSGRLGRPNGVEAVTRPSFHPSRRPSSGLAVQGEVAKLGIEISQRTVGRLLPRCGTAHHGAKTFP